MSDTITCTINAVPRRLDVSADTPLLTVLRETLGLKATRFGCGTESCGACTILVNGQPRYACTLPVGEVAGADILTAESLGRENPGRNASGGNGPGGRETGGDGTDHPLLTAFIDHQAGQCGYCLPGIVMRARALLDSDAPVNRASVAEALDPCLCRCGAHQRILDAVLAAARSMDRTA